MGSVLAHVIMQRLISDCNFDFKNTFQFNKMFISKLNITLYTNGSPNIYWTSKETHLSLFWTLMEKRIKKWKYILYTYFNNQICMKLLNNVTVLLKGIDYCPIEIIKGLADKFIINYLIPSWDHFIAPVGKS